MRATKKAEPCWCGGACGIANCCEPHLLGVTYPQTAAQLMRSRYSAFVTHNAAYLLATWHPKTRPASIEFDEQQRWLGLKLVQTEAGGVSDAQGTVMFVARYRIAGRGHRLQELSQFTRIDGRWFYMTGEIIEKSRR